MPLHSITHARRVLTRRAPLKKNKKQKLTTMPFDPASLLSVAPAAIDGAANLITGSKSAKRNYKYGEKAAQNNYNRQMDAWNKANEYNLPSNVRKRLEDAGLSVGLMYSGNGASAGNAGGLSSVAENQGAATHRPPTLGFGQKVLDAMALQSQIELNKSQARKNDAEAAATSGYRAENTAADTDLKRSSAELNYALQGNAKAQQSLNEFQLGLQTDMRDLTIQQAKANVENTVQNFKKLLEDTEQMRLVNTYSRNTLDSRAQIVNQQLTNLTADLIVKAADVELKKSNKQLNSAEIGKITQLTRNLSIEELTLSHKNRKAKYDADMTAAELSDYLVSGMKGSGIGQDAIRATMRTVEWLGTQFPFNYLKIPSNYNF